jgi:hypothetical protein
MTDPRYFVPTFQTFKANQNYSIADSPILYASDGFVQVTGYNRKDIIPRNCRWLQGDPTDPNSPRRLRTAIEGCEETVELLLNYRKNGDPFWNLLYISFLLNERGEVAFFLGGQINCSTTIHSCNDVLRILSINEMSARKKASSIRSWESSRDNCKVKSSFFKSWREYNPSGNPAAKTVVVRNEAGMEPELINRLGNMGFTTQVEAFYTAYSKVRPFSLRLFVSERDRKLTKELVYRHGIPPPHGNPSHKILLPRNNPHPMSQPTKWRHRPHIQQRYLQSALRTLLLFLLISFKILQAECERCIG